ncbi:RNA-directed DNA polymerase (Reverse transcriptase) [Trifolium medium]|uniref:RNA-directed DNA polymerase (Reverse transcriptase) n=1 Tax=Trifolium medium TaxID=97028 RepID=A0A392MGN4_9FABA|nr:RNA-directed DNA polymerase (Reverse transcriptase) [Trifolium medium]
MPSIFAPEKLLYKLIIVLRDGDNVITETSEIASIIVNHFQNLFTTNNVLQDNNLIDNVIPHLVDDQVNSMITSIPSPEEIKKAVFSLNKDSAPGPDGFSGFFYQTYWEIIQKEVCNAVMEFFSTGFLLPNWNANSIVLIPKMQHADTVDQFRQ